MLVARSGFGRDFHGRSRAGFGNGVGVEFKVDLSGCCSAGKLKTFDNHLSSVSLPFQYAWEAELFFDFQPISNDVLQEVFFGKLLVGSI